VFFLLLDAWVLNMSPTGALQRFLVDSWDGTVALAEQLGTKLFELRGIPWASSMPSEADPSAFMRRALCTIRMLLSADLWIDASGAPVLPQIPASREEPADFGCSVLMP
jgi:hypothetical protein